MSKKELIAAIRDLDAEQSVHALRKLSAEDLEAKYKELTRAQTTTERVKPFRERPEVKPLLEQFKVHRTTAFQPAIYKADDVKLADALRSMKDDLHAIAEAAGVEV